MPPWRRGDDAGDSRELSRKAKGRSQKEVQVGRKGLHIRLRSTYEFALWLLILQLSHRRVPSRRARTCQPMTTDQTARGMQQDEFGHGRLFVRAGCCVTPNRSPIDADERRHKVQTSKQRQPDKSIAANTTARRSVSNRPQRLSNDESIADPAPARLRKTHESIRSEPPLRVRRLTQSPTLANASSSTAGSCEPHARNKTQVEQMKRPPQTRTAAHRPRRRRPVVPGGARAKLRRNMNGSRAIRNTNACGSISSQRPPNAQQGTR